MRIIFLNGKESEIAKGYLQSSKDIQKNIKYYLKFRKKILIRNINNLLKKPIIRGLENYYYSCFEKNFEDDYRTLIKEFANNMQIKYRDFYKLVLIPDLITYLFSKFSTLKIPHIFLGCSSCIRKHENGIVHGRNLDFFGGNIWANNHELIVVTPENGQKYITISAKGFFSPGVTAINESLISISLHMLYTDEINKKGMPILNLIYKILNNAHSIDEVRNILEKHHSISGWGILATDHKNKEVSIFELTGLNFKEHKVTTDTFGYVNQYITDLKSKEFLFSYIWIENNFERLKRLKELLEKNVEIHNILSDRTEFNSIANNFTISSVIFNSKDDEISVANNQVPASIGIYKTYSLSQLFNGKIVEKTHRKTETQKEDNLSILINAYDNYMVSCNKKKFLKSIDELDEKTSNLFKAVIYAKLGKFNKALEIIDSIIDANYYPKNSYRFMSIKLLKAIFLDISKNREEAIKIYRELLSQFNYPDITYWSLYLLKNSAKKNFIERIDINMFLSHFIIA